MRRNIKAKSEKLERDKIEWMISKEISRWSVKKS
jgi:hypothetical protein